MCMRNIEMYEKLLFSHASVVLPSQFFLFLYHLLLHLAVSVLHQIMINTFYHSFLYFRIISPYKSQLHAHTDSHTHTIFVYALEIIYKF